jgi:glycosyltransferase involved in cell wall biosynthesis
MEAASMGLPTVATDIAAIARYRRRQTGLLVPLTQWLLPPQSNNSADARFARHGAAARQRRRRQFDQQRIIDRTLDAYRTFKGADP